MCICSTFLFSTMLSPTICAAPPSSQLMVTKRRHNGSKFRVQTLEGTLKAPWRHLEGSLQTLADTLKTPWRHLLSKMQHIMIAILVWVAWKEAREEKAKSLKQRDMSRVAVNMAPVDAANLTHQWMDTRIRWRFCEGWDNDATLKELRIGFKSNTRSKMAGSNVQAAMRRRRSSGRSFMSVSLAGILFSTTFSSMINMGMINDIVTVPMIAILVTSDTRLTNKRYTTTTWHQINLLTSYACNIWDTSPVMIWYFE